MPRRALVADVEVISAQASSGALPYIKHITFDSTDDIITVDLRYQQLTLPVVVTIICGDIDSYPSSKSYFLSLDHAPDGYNQALTKVQSANEIRTLSEVIQQVHKAFVRLQDKARSGKLPTAEDVIIIHDSDSENDSGSIGVQVPKTTSSSAYLNRQRRKKSPATDSPRLGGEQVSLDCDSDDETIRSGQLTISPSKALGHRWANSSAGLPHQTSSVNITTAKKSASSGQNGIDDVLGEAGYASDDSGLYDSCDVGDADDAEDNSFIYYSSVGQPHPRTERISVDLTAVRQNGYYFGVLSGMDEASTENLLAISVRTSDLGLSPQMLLAWDLDPDMFIVMLIRLTSRYMGYESLINSSQSDVGLSFRIGKCAAYKPFLSDANEAFGISNNSQDNLLPDKTGATFSKILISKSLASFMNGHFLNLARYHEDTACSWADAVDAVVNGRSPNRNKGDACLPASGNDNASDNRQKRFPLLAMQFAMDQLTNCTAYCQVCHNLVEDKLRSLKPTVCSRDLCLFQYMSLGMGRSAEYEILCQPNVVDLLINFCYAALRSSLTAAIDPVRAYPTCLPLKIVDWHDPHSGVHSRHIGNRTSFILSKSADSKSSIQKFKPGQWVAIVLGRLAANLSYNILLGSTHEATGSGSKEELQPSLPHSDLRHAIVTGVDEENSTVYVHHFDDESTTIRNRGAEIYRYTKDFDDIPAKDKAAQLLILLDTLPPVTYLKSELEKPSVNDLKSVAGVSPAAAVLLRWIIATNRSCVLQIHEPKLMVKEKRDDGTLAPPENLLQFCFLQGLPEADHEFQQQVAQADNPNHPTLLAWHGSRISNWHSILRTGLDFSITMNGRAYGNGVYFSPDFTVSLQYAGKLKKEPQWPNAFLDLCSVVSLNEIINAPSKFISNTPHYVVQYANWSRCRFLFAKPESTAAPLSQPTPVAGPAPQAVSTLSSTFSAAPYRRPRYKTMAVPSAAQTPLPADTPRLPAGQTLAPTQPQSSIHRWQSSQTSPNAQNEFFQDDPERLLYGPLRGVIVVPNASMPAPSNTWEVTNRHTKRPRTKSPEEITMDASDLAFLANDRGVRRSQNKKQVAAFTVRTESSPTSKIPNGAVVIDLLSDSEADESVLRPSLKLAPVVTTTVSTAKAMPPMPLHVTSFKPGSLDYTSLPQLPLPPWCTPQAQRALGREMDRMQKVQRDTPLSELGWYIDFTRMDNMCQWIVELHSFDRTLPLAADMERLGVQSIVCELRFGADYPMSPPLVRVIRPRFVPFLQGGGGNVTSGGAMCLELLTSTGWLPAYQTDAVLLQVRLAISATDRPARLDARNVHKDYGVAEAFDAYKRAAVMHGWKVPEDMQKRMTF